MTENNIDNQIAILPAKEIEMFDTQFEIFDILDDQKNGINELLIGGGAGGGKTFDICLWLAGKCFEYPGTRRGLGRAKLKTLKTTSLKTLKEKVLKPYFGFIEGVHYRVTSPTDPQSPNAVVFNNGSEILLVDLKHYPSLDPEFDDLGSLELTGGAVDEISQITQKAYIIFTSRCGRRRNEEYGLKKMVLSSCNPSKGRVYHYFYKPRKANSLPKHISYVPVLAKDNPYIEKEYLSSLEHLPEGPIKQRLYYGNRDYGDDTYCVYSRDDLDSLTTNKAVRGERFIVCDPAGFGNDRTIVYLFEGRKIVKIWIQRKSTPESVKKLIRQIANQYQVKRKNWIYDGVGIGRGLTGLDCKVFTGSAAPIEDKRKQKGDQQQGAITKNYLNLRSQCFFELAVPMKQGIISLPSGISAEMFAEIIEELETIQQWNVDKDGPMQIIPKEEIKKLIGRSPDHADVFCMRMFFELDKKPTPSFA